MKSVTLLVFTSLQTPSDYYLDGCPMESTMSQLTLSEVVDSSCNETIQANSPLIPATSPYMTTPLLAVFPPTDSRIPECYWMGRSASSGRNLLPLRAPFHHLSLVPHPHLHPAVRLPVGSRRVRYRRNALDFRPPWHRLYSAWHPGMRHFCPRNRSGDISATLAY